MDENDVAKIARQVRYLTLKSIRVAGSGHLGGSLSLVDILTVLYFDWLNIDPSNPRTVNRDRLILSKGHAAPALYATLALRGFFPIEELSTLRSFESRLQGHPDMKLTPGVDFSAGSLGQGLSAGLGMALTMRLLNTGSRAVVLLGDGELNEGQIWETASLASHYSSGNLIAIVDCNGFQQDGKVASWFDVPHLEQRWASVGWSTKTIDGHDIKAIRSALPGESRMIGNPLVILAKTTKGKGFAFAEDNNAYHSDLPDLDLVSSALAEIEAK